MSDVTGEQIVERITAYLCSGGNFNPEAMDHDKVRALLIDCRQVLQDKLSKRGTKTTVRKVWRNELNRGDNFDWPTHELAERSVRNFGKKKFSRIAVPTTITETEGH